MILEEYSKVLMEADVKQDTENTSTKQTGPTKQEKIKAAFDKLTNYWKTMNSEDLDLTDERQKGRLQQLLKISKHLDDVQNQKDFSNYGYQSEGDMETAAQSGFGLVKDIRNQQAAKDQETKEKQAGEDQAAKEKQATKDQEAKEKRLAKISDKQLLAMQQQYEKLKDILDKDPSNKRAKELLIKLKASLEKHQEKGHKFAQMPKQVEKYDDYQIKQITDKTIKLIPDGYMLGEVPSIVQKLVPLYLKNMKKQGSKNFQLNEGLPAWAVEWNKNRHRKQLKKHLEALTQDMQIDLDDIISSINKPGTASDQVSKFHKRLKKDNKTLKDYIDQAINKIEKGEQ